MRCPNCYEFINNDALSHECGWVKVDPKIPRPRPVIPSLTNKHGTPFRDEDNAKIARQVIEAIKAGPDAIKALTEQLIQVKT